MATCKMCGQILKPHWQQCPACATPIDRTATISSAVPQTPTPVPQVVAVPQQPSIDVSRYESTIRELKIALNQKDAEVKALQQKEAEWDRERATYKHEINELQKKEKDLSRLVEKYQQADKAKMDNLQSIAEHLSKTIKSREFDKIRSHLSLSKETLKLVENPKLYNPVDMEISNAPTYNTTTRTTTPSTSTPSYSSSGGDVVVMLPSILDSEECKSALKISISCPINFSSFDQDMSGGFFSSGKITFVLWYCSFDHREAAEVSADLMKKCGGNCVFVLCVPAELLNESFMTKAIRDDTFQSGTNWFSGPRPAIVFIPTQDSTAFSNKLALKVDQFTANKFTSILREVGM